MRLSIFGLGKLGLCTAACFAARGHTVMGFDLNPDLMAALQARQNPLRETGLDELLSQAWQHLTVTDDIDALVTGSEVSLIIVPTPSQPDGRFSNRLVEEVLKTLGPVLKKKPDFHVVDVVSTVMPGSSEGVFKPLLERLTGKKCGRDFGLVYNPEFIALGSVLYNFLNPDLVLIGASDDRSRDLVRELYLGTCDNSPHIAAMSLINAEIAKLSLNAYITLKISFANELAGLCERLPGADVDVITGALGQDSRIGGKCLKGGLGFGGPCFPRDNLALQAVAREFDAPLRLSPQVVQINEAMLAKLSRLIREHTRPRGQVALLGLSYKPHTHIVEESQSLKLAQSLAQAGYSVRVHDPQALEEAKSLLEALVTYWEDPYACLTGADTVALLTNWPLYAQLDWEGLTPQNGGRPLLLDAWRTLQGRSLKNFRYLPLGAANPVITVPEPIWGRGSQPPHLETEAPG